MRHGLPTMRNSYRLMRISERSAQFGSITSLGFLAFAPKIELEYSLGTFDSERLRPTHSG